MCSSTICLSVTESWDTNCPTNPTSSVAMTPPCVLKATKWSSAFCRILALVCIRSFVYCSVSWRIEAVSSWREMAPEVYMASRRLKINVMQFDSSATRSARGKAEYLSVTDSAGSTSEATVPLWRRTSVARSSRSPNTARAASCTFSSTCRRSSPYRVINTFSSAGHGSTSTARATVRAAWATGSPASSIESNLPTNQSAVNECASVCSVRIKPS